MQKLSLPFLLILLACPSFAASSSRLVPADDPRFHYEGRIDRSQPAAPAIIWQASRVEIDFYGDSLAFQFSELDGDVYFDLVIDDKTAILKAKNGSVANPIALAEGPHSLALVKRSEASVGTVRFDGIFVSDPDRVSKPASKNRAAKLLFFGDSITAGACNEDPGKDQWSDRSTHNANRSYAALTAAALNAAHRNIAISGMGVSIGYQPDTFPEIWDALYPKADSPRADVSDYVPDFVFINLGENDDSFTTNQGEPFPADYAQRYVTMVKRMREAYPQATIVILRGGMYGGAQSKRLAEPWTEVVNTLESEDPNIVHFVFKHWSQQHPRVSDHQAMADELTAWMKKRFPDTF